MMLELETAKGLRNYLNHRSPCGPVDARLFRHDETILKVLFNIYNNIYKEIEEKKPSFLIGKKGSGKTSFMRGMFLNGNKNVVIQITTDLLLESIKTIIDQITQRTMFNESVSKLWESIFYILIISGVDERRRGKSSDYSSDYIVTRTYLSGMGIKAGLSTDNVLNIIADMLSQISSRILNGNIEKILNEFTFNEISYNDAIRATKNIIMTESLEIVILIDSMDEYDVESENFRRSIAGLISSIGSVSNPNDHIGIILCLPEEILEEFSKLSYAPSRDFQSQLRFFWNETELIRILVQRLSLYLELYYPEVYNVLDLNSVRLNFCIAVELSDASGQYGQSIQLPWPSH